MGAMKELIDMFKSLPPELRLMVAMAGLGTPMGAIWLIKRFVFPDAHYLVIVFGVAAVVAVVALVGWLLTRDA